MKSEIFCALILTLGYCATSGAQTRAFISAQTKHPNVAIFVFPGVQVIDFAGPFEVFMQARSRVYTVGEKPDPIKTAGGLTITPEYTFENAPKPDVLVLPGGDSVFEQIKNPVALKWIAETAKTTQQTLTVCSGAFLAAKAGLLDRRSATTFYGLLDYLRETSPATKVVWDKKYVDGGNVVTSAGLSSGIEGSLYVVSKVLGMGHAQSVALNMEYNWNPDSTYARAMFPDMNIPDELPAGLPKGSDLLTSSGDRGHWTITVRVPGEKDAAGVLKNVNASLAKSGKWSEAAGRVGENSSKWNFTDRFGAKWQSVVSVKPDDDSSLLFTLKMDRI
jgi:putative intracellular protease/amidase